MWIINETVTIRIYLDAQSLLFMKNTLAILLRLYPHNFEIAKLLLWRIYVNIYLRSFHFYVKRDIKFGVIILREIFRIEIISLLAN